MTKEKEEQKIDEMIEEQEEDDAEEQNRLMKTWFRQYDSIRQINSIFTKF